MEIEYKINGEIKTDGDYCDFRCDFVGISAYCIKFEKNLHRECFDHIRYKYKRCDQCFQLEKMQKRKEKLNNLNI